MDWNKIFTGILPLLGVIVGGYITYLTQTKTLNKQFKREVDKDRESKNIERLKIYGEVLKLDGEYLMVEYIGGGRGEFNLDTYVEKVRPILYSKFYLLNQNVADNVRKIDSIITSFNEYGIQEHQNEELIDLFNQIISDIQKHIKEYNF